MCLSSFNSIAYFASVIEEPPNILTLVYQLFQDTPWAQFMHAYENIFFSIIAALLVALFFQIGLRKRDLIPEGAQNFVETVVESILKIISGILGSEGVKYIPFLGTLFIYILVMNLMGLVPLMKAPSSSLNITIALALCVFFYVQYLNVKNFGFFGFLHHMAGSPKNLQGWLLAPILFPLELLSQISRPVTLSLRLFGNVMGEEALIGYFALAGISYFIHDYFPLGLPLQLPFMLLGLLTSFMQALVFTLLSTVYILLSKPDEKHGH